MTALKFVSWNMAWLSDLFLSQDEEKKNNNKMGFKPDDEKPNHSDDPKATVRKRRDDLKAVIEEIDPDVLVVLEGPNREEQLQLLCDTDWTFGKWKAYLQPNKGVLQNIGIIVRVDRDKFADVPVVRKDSNAEKAFQTWELDTDEDSVKEVYRFERLPLYAEIYPKTGAPFRVLGLHLKSKGIFSALEWSQWWALSEGNSRKILAETGQIRTEFLDPYLTKPETKQIPLIVCGDINDGPGMDASEKRLYGSGVERLMGSVWSPELCMHNALFDILKPKDRKALKFEELATTSYVDPIFNRMRHHEWIDHILHTPNVKAGWISNPAIHEVLKGKQKIWQQYPNASDHYPVSVDIDTSA